MKNQNLGKIMPRLGSDAQFMHVTKEASHWVFGNVFVPGHHSTIVE
jgi:hypothetical protein